MKAIVVYDGNTEKIGQAICSGMKQSGFAGVECKAAGNVSAADLQNYDFWIMGGNSAGFLAGRKVQGLLKKAGANGAKKTGVAFDTRPAGTASGMAEKLAALMKGSGVNVTGSTYFSLGPSKALMDGEEALAVIFGKNLVSEMK